MAIAAVVVFALGTLWVFADLYEKSMPDDVIDSYVSQLSTDLWEEGLAEQVTFRFSMGPDDAEESVDELTPWVMN